MVRGGVSETYVAGNLFRRFRVIAGLSPAWLLFQPPFTITKLRS